jgi:hypothetical protein
MAHSRPTTLDQPPARGKRLGRLKRPATLAANVTEAVFQIRWGDLVFHLHSSIDLTARREGRHWLVGYDPIGIEGYGDSRQEALESFAEQFYGAWKWIAEAPDTSLTKDGAELKRKLLGLVAEVQAAG